jgi:hypothetical protein
MLDIEKIIAVAKGTKTGAIVACAFDKNEPNECPRFEGTASLTSDGFLMCDFVDSDGECHMGAFVGDVSSYRNNIQKLADHCGLAGRERAEFMGVMNGWVANKWGCYTAAV